MPLAKRPSKKSLSHTNKCPRCNSRSYKKKEKTNFFEKLLYAGCKVWKCNKCLKTWAF